jgi:hypothetical protein
MAKGMRPLRLTKSVQNVAPVPKDRPNLLNKGTNMALKLRQPKITGGFKPPKGTFA